MRIVGGRHRGRQIEAPADLPIRPTSDRAREALFNILEHGKLAPGGLSPVRGARVLDAFCGTGALGLEALSRGAAHAVFLESDAAALRLARRNAARLQETAHATFLAADATRPPAADQPCTLVFLDPPYAGDVLEPALAGLAKSGWIASGAIVVAEVERRTRPPQGDLALVDERVYGKAKLLFYRA
ncbi:MAG TPA: 16S rRNA (guanine(966)-N(2))-methyltransferase RsmD [Alphaproteobacteria bacterium]|nr:16S rRNA (guanine(966)-N(2))-methyltransferase RsmD [Alphaproteobacteria bacterium]